MKRKPAAPRDLTPLEKADKLRAFGFHVKLRAKKKQTPQLKAAVSRLYNQHAHFLNPKPGTAPAKFFKTTAKDRRLAARVLSSKSLTPGGFWLQVPKGVKPSSYRVKVTKGAVVEKIRGRQNDRILPLSARDMAVDPMAAFRAAVAREAKRHKGKKPRQAQLIVNGFQGKRVQSLKSMLFYLENNPRFLDEVAELDEDELADTFQLKLIYGSKAHKADRRQARGAKAQNKKVRRR